MPTAIPSSVASSKVSPGVSPKRWLLGSDEDPRGVRGAVLVEFAVAVMPLLILFFTFVQAAFAYTANLALRHAANTGARAAAVILPPNPGNVGTAADVDKSVEVALGHWFASFESVTITQTPPTGPNELVSVEVTATYKCSVPLGGRVMCGADGLLAMAPIKARYPHQGARYKR